MCVCVGVVGAIIEGSPFVAKPASVPHLQQSPRVCMVADARLMRAIYRGVKNLSWVGTSWACLRDVTIPILGGCVCVCSVRPLVPPDVHHQEPCLRRIMISADPTWRRAGYGCPLRRSQWQLYSTNPNRDRTENLWVAVCVCVCVCLCVCVCVCVGWCYYRG